MNTARLIENTIDVNDAWRLFLEVNIVNTRLAKEGIIKFFRKKTRADMMYAMEQLTSATLYWICTEIALPVKDYEICNVAVTLLNKRKYCFG